MMGKIKTLLAVTILTTLSLTANASLIGDTITITHNGGFGFATDNVVVGAGAEIQMGDGSDLATNIFTFMGDALDVSDSSILISIGASFNLANELLTFSDLDWVGMTGSITGATLAFSNIPEITQSDISFGADFVSVQLGGMSGFTDPQGRTFQIDIEAAHVPEPATLALFGLGLAGLGIARRKQKQQ